MTNMEKLEEIFKTYEKDIKNNDLKRFVNEILCNCGAIMLKDVENALGTMASDYHDIYVIIDDVVFSTDKTRLVRYSPEKTDETYVIPEFVETICDGAFQGSEHLKQVTISKNIRHIGSRAFSDSSSLAEIMWDTPEATGGSYVFVNCPKLKTVITDDAQKLANYVHDNEGSPFVNGAQLIVNGESCDISILEGTK